jgi:hypothetical protein
MIGIIIISLPITLAKTIIIKTPNSMSAVTLPVHHRDSSIIKALFTISAIFDILNLQSSILQSAFVSTSATPVPRHK